MFKIDREKYMRLVKTDGLHVALTTLHHDLNEWEHQTFEGEAGWQPEVWTDLAEVRNFSRELWDISLYNSSVKF
jgi:hypothetical protein